MAEHHDAAKAERHQDGGAGPGGKAPPKRTHLRPSPPWRRSFGRAWSKVSAG